jgi:predicted dehydrogenase
MLKVGIIGTGNIAKSHADALATLPELKLIAVSEIDQTKGESFAAERQCTWYADYHQMLRQESLDAVAVCLPHHLHFEAGMAVLNAGRHLLMEKPMANTVEECDALVAKAAEKNLKIVVGQTHQYYTALQEAKRLLQEGAIGQLTMIIDTVYGYYNWEKRLPWFLDPAKGGGGPLMNTGPHQIDHLLYLAGAEPVYVRAAVGHNRPEYQIESDILAHIEFANGVAASLLLCQGYTFKTDQICLRLIGTKGMMEIDPWGNIDLSQGATTQQISCSFAAGYDREWQDLATAITQGSKPGCDGVYGRNVVALIDAIYRSGREGKSIEFSGCAKRDQGHKPAKVKA